MVVVMKGDFFLMNIMAKVNSFFLMKGLLRVNGLMVSFMKAFVFLLMAINMRVNF